MSTHYPIRTTVRRTLSDTVTPVGIYLQLREKFPQTLLLESSDYRAAENSFSYICVDPIANITLENGEISEQLPGNKLSKQKIIGKDSLAQCLESFLKKFHVEATDTIPGVINGLFGYTAYSAIEQIEDLKLQGIEISSEKIPQARYSLYRYIIAINHFKDELYLLENECKDHNKPAVNILELIHKEKVAAKKFSKQGSEQSNLTDDQHKEIIAKCKTHILRGDVFQIVPSRKFTQPFSGDDFQVYRALRSLNPSPYLFYFDYGSYHIFGSSPEAQLIVQNSKASIFPIAGTYRRSGDDIQDSKAAQALLDDPKESAEHVMLVDLARNDLSIFCHEVTVEKFKEVQYYSHVIHLVSKVTGTLNPQQSAVAVLSATFPAGTLTGAPKYKAMQLIDTYEPGRRSFYGGAIGFIGFNGGCNHAIMIRSFLSKEGILHSQSGSGIVADSNPSSEVAEVNNKLGALRAAIKLAEEL